jgi:hypothetical protein
MKNGFWFEGRRCKLEISEIGKKSISIETEIETDNFRSLNFIRDWQEINRYRNRYRYRNR